MAIDTEQKRRSVLNLGIGGRWRVLPVADGTIDGGDIQHILGFYSGIPWGGPAVITPDVAAFSLDIIRSVAHESALARTVSCVGQGAIVRTITQELEY